MNLQEFHRGQFVLFGLNQQKNFAASRTRRGLCVWLFVACFSLLSLSGCQDFNPNLGASSSQASTIALIAPSSRPAGCSGFILDVRGIGFISSAVVNWNGAPRATNFESSGELLATINNSDIATQAPVSIVVDTPGQTQGNNLSNFVSFTIAPPPIQGTSTCPAPPAFLPTLAALNVNSGTVGSPLEIAGNYFGGVQGTSTVTLNGVTATIQSWSGTLLTVTVPTIAIPQGSTSITVPVLVNVNGVASLVPSPGANLFTVLASSPSSQILTSSLAATSRNSAATSNVRYVAFVASSSDPSSGQTTVDKIFLRDTCQSVPAGCSPVTVPVSVGFDGTDPNGGSRTPTVSANGRFVAFASDANNLVRGDANGVSDIFLRDTCIGAGAGCVPTTTRVSAGPDGIEPNGASASPSISSDGRFVVFSSVATNLASGNQFSSATNTEARFLWDSCLGAANGCNRSLTKLKFQASR